MTIIPRIDQAFDVNLISGPMPKSFKFSLKKKFDILEFQERKNPSI